MRKHGHSGQMTDSSFWRRGRGTEGPWQITDGKQAMLTGLVICSTPCDKMEPTSSVRQT
ncbi:unnamed protein product [Staurois parvus]|uniref:Uncharacterized protein n=1 Tax=Staurois parvus TaxID=386267 RepID=A0ABN9HCR0_9NEOB|nr:unnamed protein product [Staurois parvus]